MTEKESINEISPENWFNSKCPKCKKGSLAAHAPNNPKYTHFCIGRNCSYQRPKSQQ